MTRAVYLTVLSALTLLWGCGSKDVERSAGETGETGDTGHVDTPRDPCLEDALDFQIGTGENEFELLDDGDTVEVIHGTQDGHHILGSVRIQNTTPVAAIQFEVIPEADGLAVSDQVYRLQLSPDPENGECAGQVIGMYAYLGRIDPGTAAFLNEATTMRMTITSEAGDVVSKQLQVFPYLPAIEH